MMNFEIPPYDTSDILLCYLVPNHVRLNVIPIIMVDILDFSLKQVLSLGDLGGIFFVWIM